MADEPKRPTPPLVIKTDRHPCGCVVEHYADGRELKDPCPPCGLVDVGMALQHAGAALCAVASSIARGGPKPTVGPSSPLKRV